MSHQIRHHKPHVFVKKSLLDFRDENAVWNFLDIWAYENKLFVQDWRYDPGEKKVRWTDNEGGPHLMSLEEIKKIVGGHDHA